LCQKEAFAVMDMAEVSQDMQSATDLLKTQGSANDDIEVNRFFLYYLQNADDLFRVFCFFFLGCFFFYGHFWSVFPPYGGLTLKTRKARIDLRKMQAICR
jgi:hypothetical protein